MYAQILIYLSCAFVQAVLGTETLRLSALNRKLRDIKLEHAKEQVKKEFGRNYTTRTGKLSKGFHSDEEEEDEEDDGEALSPGDIIVVRRSHNNKTIRAKHGKVKSIGIDGMVKVRLEKESKDREIVGDDLRRPPRKGPFQTLAFDGLDESERVMITPESERWLLLYTKFATCLGCALFVLPTGLWYGMFELLDQDFEVDEVSFLGEQAESLFFPSKGCIKDSLLVVYAWLLMIVWMPAAIIGAVVWPLWLVSLQLGVALVADDVEDLMKELDPAGPVIPKPLEHKKAKDLMLQSTDTMFQSADSPGLRTPKGKLTDTQRQARQDRDFNRRQERLRDQERLRLKQERDEKKWELTVALPGAMLVSTMEELSVWGPSMGFAFVGCICTALTLVPTAVAMESTTMFLILVIIFFIPLQIAYAPANVRA